MRRRSGPRRVIHGLRAAAGATMIVVSSCKAAPHGRAITHRLDRTLERDSSADLRPDSARATLARELSHTGVAKLPRIFLDTKPAPSRERRIPIP
ncbi:MAG: hypothetical protein ACR2OG_10270 [Gemmatimonadaceae bacterium]